MDKFSEFPLYARFFSFMPAFIYTYDHYLFEDHGGSTVCHIGQWATNLVRSNQLFEGLNTH
jgi:hypothetical protein